MTPSSWLPGLRSLFARTSLRERVSAGRSSLRRRRSSFEHLEDRLVFALTLDIIPPTVTETWGFFAATVYRTGNLSQPLTVNLSSSDTGKATVPASIQIPANAASRNFNITVINDTRLDGDTLVTIRAWTHPDDAVTDSFTVINNDFVTLRPAPANDTIVLTPTGTAGELNITQGPLEPSTLGPRSLAGFGAGSMVQTVAVNSLVESNAFLPVDLAKTYALTGWAKSGDELGQRFDAANRQSFGFRSYDADYLLIQPAHVLRHIGSNDTRLAAPLNPGDTVIRLVNASGWSNTSGLGAATRGIAWYGYQDSHGANYADYTYTRNIALGGANGLWSPGGVSGNLITLSAPWSGPALAAGTAVRNTGAGSDTNWSALRSQSVGGDWNWTNYGAVFGGAALAGGLDSGSLFRPGTAYIKPVMQVNEQGTPGNFIQWRDVALTEVPANTPSSALVPRVIDLSTVTGGDQRRLLDVPGGSPYSWSSELIKVNTQQSYALSARSTDVTKEDPRPLGFASLDVDKKLIHPLHVTKFATAIDTTLAAALNPGDTSFLVTNASGWSNATTESADSRALAWYGYQDSTGHTYANYTYTRNVAFDLDHGLWNAGGIRYDDAAGAYRVVLREPWSGPALTAGAAIRNASSGRMFNQPEASLPFSKPDLWSDYSSVVGGGEWQNGESSDVKFRPGTVYVQPVFATRSPWLNVMIVPAASTTPAQQMGSTADHRVMFTLDVLAKGALGGGPTVVIDSVVTPHHGVATIVPGSGPGGRATIQYTSEPWFIGTEEITYVLKNTANGATSTLKTSIQALGSNHEQDASVVAALAAQSADPANLAPAILFNPNYSVVSGGVLRADNIHDIGMASSVSDASTTRVARLVSGVSHGTLKLNYDGTFEYVADTDFAGIDSFRFEIYDGRSAVSLIATISVLLTDESLILHRLKNLAIGAQNYSDSIKRLPISAAASSYDASGKPYLSWRVHLLPYLGLQGLFNQFHLDESWDSPHNLPLASQMPDIFRGADDALDSTATRFQTISAEGAPYYWRYVSERLSGPRLADITDGTSNTFLFVEVGDDQAITWTKPDDLDFDPANPLASLGTLDSEVFHAAMADASTITLPASIDADTFTSLVTVSGGELVDAATLRRQYAESQGGASAIRTFAATRGDSYFKAIALAMHNYVDSRKSTPAGAAPPNFNNPGDPIVSWRVLLLPYLGYKNLYDQYHLDEPWDSPNNLALLDEMPDIYRSFDSPSNSTTTRVMTLNGPATAFGYRPPGQTQVGLSFAGISDGTSQTVMFVEAGADKAVPWTKPVDLAFDVANPWAAIGQLPADQVRAVFFDARVQSIPVDTAAADFAALVTRNGRELVDSTVLASHEASRTGKLSTNGSRANDLKQLVLAMHTYADSRRRFPASTFASDGTPLLSWRVHILPFLEYGALYDEFHRDEPWDSPHNLSLLKYMPDIFRSTGDPAHSVNTRVQGFSGPGAPFPATGTNTTAGLNFAQISDGTSNTIAFAEVGSDHAVPWTKPSDTPFNPNNPWSAFGDISTTLSTAMFDGRVAYWDAASPLGHIKALITHNGGENSANPPAFSALPAVHIYQSAGNTATNEFGADWFDVVLDKAPLSNVVLSVGLSNAALAAVDKPTITFTPQNWNVPQRVTFRPVDNHVEEPDAAVDVTITVVDASSDNAYDPVANQTFTAKIIDDDARPDLPGDYNADSIVDATDYTKWRDTLGATGLAPYSGADGDGDGQVTQNDWSIWRANFGSRLSLQELLQDDAAGGAATTFLNLTESSSPASGDDAQSATESSAGQATSHGDVTRVLDFGRSDNDSTGRTQRQVSASNAVPELHDEALLLLAAARELELPSHQTSTGDSIDDIDTALGEEIELVTLDESILGRLLD